MADPQKLAEMLQQPSQWDYLANAMDNNPSPSVSGALNGWMEGGGVSGLLGHPEASAWNQMSTPEGAKNLMLNGFGFAAPIKAFHGSPYDFNAFDASKIGTGEGAQAYGRGLYFAENPSTAKAYQETLSQGVHYAEPGKPPVPITELPEAQGRAAGLLRYYGGDFDKTRQAVVNGSGDKDLLNAIDQMQQNNGSAYRGRMYEVNINAEPHQFLDWDKPLSPDVLNQLNETIPSDARGSFTKNILAHSRTGLDAYKTLENSAIADPNHVGSSSEYASQKLRDAGIPGIKYLDQGSRSSGTGTSNYVVFDPRIVDIVKKFGLLGGAGMGAEALTNDGM